MFFIILHTKMQAIPLEGKAKNCRGANKFEARKRTTVLADEEKANKRKVNRNGLGYSCVAHATFQP